MSTDPARDTRATKTKPRGGIDPREALGSLGPGLVAGASDVDPTTVASLSVIGATTTYGLSWLMLLVIPMLTIVLVVSAAVGVVCRAGLEDVVRKRYGHRWAVLMLLLVLAVTVLTLAADLEGGAAALGLLTGRPYQWFIAPLAVAAGALLIWGSYHAIERVLRYVPLVFLAYLVTVVLARPVWRDVLVQSIVPHVPLTGTYASGAIALLGTTLTSYAYVWETIETSEERTPLRRLGLVQVDAGIGTVAAGIVMWAILIATGATLGVRHAEIQTAGDAARALQPVSGPYASVLFGVGLLGSALLAVPVLAGTSAYVLAEAFGWRASLDAAFRQARAFYLALILSLAVAVGVTLVGIGPIQLLFVSSIAGGLATPITLAILMVAARDSRTMGRHRIGAKLAIAGWAVTAIVTLASALYFVSLVA